jgi:hypothetical protein
MSFWDQPEHWPGDTAWPKAPGGTVEGTISRMAVMQNRYQRNALCIELDGDGVQRWCNGRLWRALADIRADVGDRIRVTRGPDGEAQPGRSASTSWTVDRLTPAGAPAVQPTWPQQVAPAAAGASGWAAPAFAAPVPDPAGPRW